MSMSVSRLVDSITVLLEDRDPFTGKVLDSYLRKHFMDMEEDFHRFYNSAPDTEAAEKVFRVIHKYTAESMLEALSEAVSMPERDTLREWFLISKMILPTAEYEPMLARFISLQERIMREQAEAKTSRGRINAIIKLYYRYFITKRTRDEDVPLSAILPTEVVETGTGIPIVVDILFVVLLEMLGYEVLVYMLDDAFLPSVCDLQEPQKRFVFLMDEGRVLSSDRAEEMYGDSRCAHGSAALLELLTSVMADIFRISGENDRSAYMSRAHDIITGK